MARPANPAYAGLRRWYSNPLTGGHVGVYDGREAGLDTDAGRWSTTCEEHGVAMAHDTLAGAISSAREPAEWCEECAALEDNATPAEPANEEDTMENFRNMSLHHDGSFSLDDKPVEEVSDAALEAAWEHAHLYAFSWAYDALRTERVRRAVYAGDAETIREALGEAMRDALGKLFDHAELYSEPAMLTAGYADGAGVEVDLPVVHLVTFSGGESFGRPAPEDEEVPA